MYFCTKVVYFPETANLFSENSLFYVGEKIKICFCFDYWFNFANFAPFIQNTLI